MILLRSSIQVIISNKRRKKMTLSMKGKLKKQRPTSNESTMSCTLIRGFSKIKAVIIAYLPMDHKKQKISETLKMPLRIFSNCL
jgi:hypothetical protein